MKDHARFSAAVVTFLGLLLVVWPAYGQTGAPANLTSAEGLQVVTFTVPEGKIKVNLPGDMAAGDTISGTVITEPKGSNAAEKAQNQGVLNGYVIDVGEGNQVKADQRQFTINVPRALSGGRFAIKVVSILGANNDPFGIVNLKPSPRSPTVPSTFNYPALGQQGHPLTITGPFDGNAANTTCTIGGQPVTVLAESPTSTTLLVPGNVTGPAPIQVNENGASSTGQTRVVGMDLTSPKLVLSKGENTTVTVNVTGLEGISGNVPLNVVTTGAVNMQGGNTQNIQIQPSQVQAGGNYSQTFNLTATQAGGFNVTAVVTNPPPTQPRCKCGCKFAPTEVTTDGERASVEGGGTEYAYKPNVSTTCSGNNCTKSVAYKWTVGGTAKFKIQAGTDSAERLVVDVTEGGTLILSVTVTVTCGDATCTCVGSRTFDVTAPKKTVVTAPGPTGVPPGPAGTPPDPTTGGGTPKPDVCKCSIRFAPTEVTHDGEREAVAGGATEYAFTPNYSSSCSGPRCTKTVTYAWTVTGTAAYTIHADTAGSGRLVIDVTGDGTVNVSVTVTITCSNGSSSVTCTGAGSASFEVKNKHRK